MLSDRLDERRVRRAAVVEEAVMQRTRSAQLLTQELRLDVVHVGGSLRNFMSWLQSTDRSRWPHLLVIDLPTDDDSLRDLDVLVALREAGMRVLILSALHSRSTARRMLALGIDAVVSTLDSEGDFVRAAEHAIAGSVTVTPRARAAIDGTGDAGRLSRQEERAFALYASGLTIAEVAEQIGVRQDTARKYLKRVRDKFTIAGRPARTKLDLARIAWADGYLTSIRTTTTTASGTDVPGSASSGRSRGEASRRTTRPPALWGEGAEGRVG